MREINFTIKIPEIFYRFLKNIKRKSLGSLNLTGDRQIEWSFVIANIPNGPGEAMDFGPGSGSYLGLIAALKGFEVVAVDLDKVDWFYVHPNLKFIQGDFLKLDFPPKSFDLIINCSTIEHVGLAGRYGVKENRPDGDLKVMAKMREILKPKGVMLLTIPVGKDAVFTPLHRVYGKDRLPRLVQDFVVEKKKYWIKNEKNQWVIVKEEKALSLQPQRAYYGLGCFILRAK